MDNGIFNRMRYDGNLKENNFFNIPPKPCFYYPAFPWRDTEKPLKVLIDDYPEVFNIVSSSYDEQLTLDVATEVQDIVSELTPPESFVLNSFYGLNDTPELTMEEIGDVLGVQRERVRQIKSKALKKLSSDEYSSELYSIFDY
jgi:RNA polymerase sigma factor (sigma-70 family)